MTHRHVGAEALDLTVDALAVWRATRLITEDKIFSRQRDWIVLNAPDSLAYLVTCPHCVSQHVGLVAVAARTLVPGIWSPIARALALSAVTSLTTVALDRGAP